MALSQTTSHHSGSDHASADEECVEESWETYFEHEQLKKKRYSTFTWMMFPSFQDMLSFCDAPFKKNVKVYFGITSSPLWRMYDPIFSDESSVWPRAFEWSHMTILYQGGMGDCGRCERCLIARYQDKFHRGMLENSNIGGEQAKPSKPGFLYVNHNTLSAQLKLMDEYRRLIKQSQKRVSPIVY